MCFHSDELLLPSAAPLAIKAHESLEIAAPSQQAIRIPAGEELRIEAGETIRIAAPPMQQFGPNPADGAEPTGTGHASATLSASSHRACVISASEELVMESSRPMHSVQEGAATYLDAHPCDMHFSHREPDLVFSSSRETVFSPVGSVAKSNEAKEIGTSAGVKQLSAADQGPCIVREVPCVRKDLQEQASIIHATWQDT